MLFKMDCRFIAGVADTVQSLSLSLEEFSTNINLLGALVHYRKIVEGRDYPLAFVTVVMMASSECPSSVSCTE